MHVKVKASDMMKYGPGTSSVFHENSNMSGPVEWETLLLKLNDSKRYRRTVGSIAGSCLKAATPQLASLEQAACLVALDIVVDGICALDKVEAAYRKEVEAKEAIEEVIQLCSLYQLKDTIDVADDGADENRLLPAMNKIWPFLVVCIQSGKPVVVRRCLSVISTVVQVCGGDFFSRRFHTDGPHFWKLLTTSPFQRKPKLKEPGTSLQLPYRSISISSEESLAEVSNLKVHIAVLNMIADLAQNKRSASALEVVLKKVSGIVVGIACSGVVGLRDASVNALQGLSSIDPDLVWILLADVYYSLKKKDLPSPPTSDLPEFSQVLPPPSTPKGFLYVEYGGQTYGFDVDFSSVEVVFKKMHSLVFSDQIYY
ncbi:TELO2-interacting protein 1 homolog isoform X2 [Carica papaya]|nr:TELO2-interacting protein 1 homolog isoform X2 [Carica papaya]